MSNKKGSYLEWFMVATFRDCFWGMHSLTTALDKRFVLFFSVFILCMFGSAAANLVGQAYWDSLYNDTLLKKKINAQI